MFVVGKKLFSITGTWASMTPANSSLASSTFVLLFPHVARWRTLDPTYCSACKHKGIQFQELEPKRGTQYQHTKKTIARDTQADPKGPRQVSWTTLHSTTTGRLLLGFLLVKYAYLSFTLFRVIDCALLPYLINLPFVITLFYLYILFLRIYQLIFIYSFFLHNPPRIAFVTCG